MTISADQVLLLGGAIGIMGSIAGAAWWLRGQLGEIRTELALLGQRVGHLEPDAHRRERAATAPVY